MAWTVLYHDAFLPEMEALGVEVQDSLLVAVELLQARGPSLGRPHVDTLVGSKHANMKELRFRTDAGVWRGLRLRSRAAGHHPRGRRQEWGGAEKVLQAADRQG